MTSTSNKDNNQDDIDKTFENLRRVPFDQVLGYVCEYIWGGNPTALQRQNCIDLWANHNSMPPSEDWIGIYRSMGWEWEELVAEAGKRRFKK